MKKLIFCIIKFTAYFGMDPRPHPDPLVTRGSVSGSFQKCHGSGTLNQRLTFY